MQIRDFKITKLLDDGAFDSSRGEHRLHVRLPLQVTCQAVYLRQEILIKKTALVVEADEDIVVVITEFIAVAEKVSQVRVSFREEVVKVIIELKAGSEVNAAG